MNTFGNQGHKGTACSITVLQLEDGYLELYKTLQKIIQMCYAKKYKWCIPYNIFQKSSVSYC